jgi:exonuclease III
LRGKSLQMLELIHTEQPDVILCQETKLDKTVSSAEVFP